MSISTKWFERGHVAIVTGGSKGLGKALTRRLLQLGLSVIIDGRNSDALERARAQLQNEGNVVALRGDVGDKHHAHALVAAARELGRLDLLVNNASTLGETPLPPIEDLSEPVFERLFKINVFAPIHLMQHALPLMRRGGGIATIVNVTSDAAVQAYPHWGGYGASKAALEHVSRVLAEEIGDGDIRILAVDPGDMDTEMHRAAVPDADSADLIDPDRSAARLLDAVARARRGYSRVSLAELQPA